jgi:hypothetical protein
MTRPKKLRADQAIDEFLEGASADEELERIASMSDAGVDGELAKLGLDPERVRANGQDIAALAEKGPPPSGVAPAQPQDGGGAKAIPLRRSVTLWLVAAAILVLVVSAGAVVAGLFRHETPNLPEQPQLPPTSVPEQLPENLAAAATLRNQAKGACAAEDWKTCAERLDAAKIKDPEGDGTPEILKMRQAIAKHAIDKPPRPGAP